nr:LysR family transcriptional regulator [uncultured Neokomagataea sp.]
MARPHLHDITAFLMVARKRSFTKAAAELGVTPSALSHTIRALEERLQLRLLSRTTRAVAPTEAGEQLQRRLSPLFEQVNTEIEAITSLSKTPSGSIRITCIDAAIETVFRPKLRAFLEKYPEINVEFSMDYALVDIVAERFDAGVRIGASLEKDMIATCISPKWRFCVVGTPAYFEKHGIPSTPHDLSSHNCINMHMKTAGGHFRWEFQTPQGREFSLKVHGQITFNTTFLVLAGALDGLGLGYMPRTIAEPYLKSGQLVEVLVEWCPEYDGYYLYYPSRKQHSPAFSAFIQAMRWTGEST